MLVVATVLTVFCAVRHGARWGTTAELFKGDTTLFQVAKCQYATLVVGAKSLHFLLQSLCFWLILQCLIIEMSSMKKRNIYGCIALALLFSGCRSHYEVASVERTRILVDSRYDQQPDAEAVAFMKPYRHQVDSMMSPVVGQVARYMAAQRPESSLSNLLADILVWAGKNYSEEPAFGLYNMGGIRAALSAGNVTYGDVLDVAPFENKICFLTLTGEKVLELFDELAQVGGEAVSHGVELVFSNRTLKSARINGKEIDPKANYRIATIDYLAQGNDRLEAFLSKTDVNSPQEESNNLRYIIMDYFREQTKQGIVVDREVEGRIKVER